LRFDARQEQFASTLFQNLLFPERLAKDRDLIDRPWRKFAGIVFAKLQ
jgi:hypothetical protein